MVMDQRSAHLNLSSVFSVGRVTNVVADYRQIILQATIQPFPIHLQFSPVESSQVSPPVCEHREVLYEWLYHIENSGDILTYWPIGFCGTPKFEHFRKKIPTRYTKLVCVRLARDESKGQSWSFSWLDIQINRRSVCVSIFVWAEVFPIVRTM